MTSLSKSTYILIGRKPAARFNEHKQMLWGGVIPPGISNKQCGKTNSDVYLLCLTLNPKVV